jgi:hypothetical protein
VNVVCLKVVIPYLLTNKSCQIVLVCVDIDG